MRYVFPLAVALAISPAASAQYLVVPSSQSHLQASYMAPGAFQTVSSPIALQATNVVPPGCVGRCMGTVGLWLESHSWPRVRPQAIQVPAQGFQTLLVVQQPQAQTTALWTIQAQPQLQAQPQVYSSPQAPQFHAPMATPQASPGGGGSPGQFQSPSQIGAVPSVPETQTPQPKAGGFK